MDDEKLIELVRKSPVLYDLNNAKYMNVEVKTQVWREIAGEMNSTVPSCKARWYNIRNNFRKSVKKFASVSERKAKYMKAYRYADSLAFLTPFFEDKESVSDVDSPIADDSSEHEKCNETQAKKDKREDGYRAPREKMRQTSTSTDSPKTAAATFMKYLLTKQQAEHPVDIFLKSLSGPLKSLTPIKFNAAKSQLFEIVQQFEREMLKSEQ